MEDTIIAAINTLWERVQEKIVETATKTVKNKFKEFVDGFRKPDANIITVELELLNKEKLVEIAKSNVVDGSTEVAAYKVVTDDDYIIYLACTKERELIDSSINKYVIIKSKSLARDIDKLFDNDKLILLN